MKAKRLGKFRITREMIEEYPKHVQQIQGMCVIYRAEYLMHRDEVEYVATSDHFDMLPRGYEAPMYEWTIDGTDIILAKE